MYILYCKGFCDFYLPFPLFVHFLCKFIGQRFCIFSKWPCTLLYNLVHFFLDFQPTEAYGFNTFFIQYYSVICGPSDHTGEAPGRDSNPGHLINFLPLLFMAKLETPFPLMITEVDQLGLQFAIIWPFNVWLWMA